MTIRFVDLFSGAGGLSLGLTDAGLIPILAIDRERLACATYAENLGQHVENVELLDLSPADLASRIGRSQDPLVVCGGPPCQGFSLQRRGPATDRRNNLVPEFFKYALELKPALILMENVPAVVSARGKHLISSCRLTLDRAGFDSHLEVLEASEYGVPQRRKRAFLVAWRRSEVGGFAFPRGAKDAPRTVRDAIGDLPEPPEDCSEHPEYPNHTRVRISALNELRISHVPAGGARKDIPEHLQLPCHRNDNGHRHLDVYGRMVWDQPGPTITAVFDNFTRGRFAHPTSNRCITAREGARLQTFPDSFVFVGGKKDIARQIGNAVPPMLAHELGKSLVDAISGNTFSDAHPLFCGSDR